MDSQIAQDFLIAHMPEEGFQIRMEHGVTTANGELGMRMQMIQKGRGKKVCMPAIRSGTGVAKAAAIVALIGDLKVDGFRESGIEVIQIVLTDLGAVRKDGDIIIAITVRPFELFSRLS